MGEIFGKYELVKKIARGGVAEVFFAHRQGEVESGAGDVAVKRLFPHLTEDQETVDIFLEEARIAETLTHPNVVQILEHGKEGEALFLAMEFVRGRDLRTILEEGYNQDNFIPIELAASLGAQVAAGLHYAHTRVGDDGKSLNIFHRDISPQNILVSSDGAVKICDFGFAKAEQHISQNHSAQVRGKFSYMAPEQIETNNVDPRSDVFALGIVLYETTTMTRLFKADSQYEALEKILYAGIEPPTTLRAGYPPELEKVVMKALERDPNARYQTAAQMQEELENWLVQSQASTSAVPLARYMRGLFPELTKPIEEQMVEATGPMQVSAEVVAAVDAKAAAEEAPEPSEPPPPPPKPSPKKDVTEMDEDDLDKALDFALGAPSEAEEAFVARDAEEPEAKEETEEETKEAPPAQELYEDEDATVVSERIPQMAELEASQAGRDHAAKLAAEASEAAAVAPPKVEVHVPTLAERSEPRAADRSAPPAGGPPAARSGAIPAAPPRAAKAPSGKSAEQKAREAFGSPDAPADLSVADIGEADLSTSKTGFIVGGLVLFAMVIGAGVIFASLDTGDSQIGKEAKKMTIDPDLLVVEVAEKGERVLASIEVTPPEVSVVVNGLPVEVSGGKIPLVKGQKNEVNVYAVGHKPGRAFVDGDGSGSPLAMTLEAMEVPPPEEVADLNIMTEPREATVWVDGKEVGTSPTTVTGLWTGVDHHVFIEKDGLFSYAGFIGLVKQSENLVKTTLAPLDSGRKNYVEVIFAALPKGATTRVNGKPIGMTPFFKNRDRNTGLTVEFEEADSVPMRRSVTLEDVGTLELRPFLQAMKREKGTITVFVEPMGPEIYVGANAYGQGPAGNLVLPEGSVKVVLDTAHGRKEVAVEVVANAHTRYVVSHSKSGATVRKKE